MHVGYVCYTEIVKMNTDKLLGNFTMKCIHYLSVYNISNHVCQNSILRIYPFSKICPIVLQFSYNLQISPNVCFFIIVFGIKVPHIKVPRTTNTNYKGMASQQSVEMHY